MPRCLFAAARRFEADRRLQLDQIEAWRLKAQANESALIMKMRESGARFPSGIHWYVADGKAMWPGHKVDRVLEVRKAQP